MRFCISQDFDLPVDTETARLPRLLVVNLVHRIYGHTGKISRLFLNLWVERIKLEPNLPEPPPVNAETVIAIP